MSSLQVSKPFFLERVCGAICAFNSIDPATGYKFSWLCWCGSTLRVNFHAASESASQNFHAGNTISNF